MTGIYRIINLRNGKSYIGQSVNIEKRVRDHLSKNRFGHNKAFDEDINRYGKEAFTYEVLEECERDQLLELERKYIAELKPEYNAVHFGGTRDDEFRKRVSQGTKLWWKNLAPEKKEKIISNNLIGPKVGHAVSEETREKLRQANLGKKQSEETIKKRSDALKARYKMNPKDGSGHFKKVGCDDIDEPFESVKACAEYFGVKACTVSAALKNNHRVKGHKVWYVV